MRCPTGQARVTISTGALAQNSKHIIHAVGPIWNGSDPAHLLYKAYYASLEAADKAGDKSIAIPPISTGIYGYPIEEATREALEAVDKWMSANPDSQLKEIRFVLFNRDSSWKERSDRYLSEMGRVFGDITMAEPRIDIQPPVVDERSPAEAPSIPATQPPLPVDGVATELPPPPPPAVDVVPTAVSVPSIPATQPPLPVGGVATELPPLPPPAVDVVPTAVSAPSIPATQPPLPVGTVLLRR